MTAPYLANFDGRIFVPENGGVCERFVDYAIAFIAENEPLDALLEAKIDQGIDSFIQFLTSMPAGLRALYALQMFDCQILNGGVSQFYTNKYWLATEVIYALEHLKLETILKEFKQIYEFINADQHLLHLVFQARNSNNDDLRFAASSAFDESIDHLAKPFEGEYYPNWSERDIHNNPTPGPFRLEMCKKCCDYIESHLHEFQVVTKN